MGRPRQYATVAARQAACRLRRQTTTAEVDRPWLAQVEASWAQVQEAVAPLARGGDPLAVQLHRAPVAAGLTALAAWFRDQARDREGH